MELPKKDKKGNSYLSYSQIQTFKRSEDDYYNIYILKTPFEGNEYTEFGNKVGEALENNDYSKFKDSEQSVLKKVTRLDKFEKMVMLKYDEFYLIGFIDTISDNSEIVIDYKTGGHKKEFQYNDKNYNQLQIYTLAIRQETGTRVTSASVEFIRRGGDAFKGEDLYVKDEAPIIIEQDITENRLKHVYWDVLKTAKEIEIFYKKNK